MQLKQTIKAFFADMRMLFKLQPFIFIATVFSLCYGTAMVIIGGIELSYFIGVTGACALIFGITKFYALKKYAEAQRADRAADIENGAAKNIATCASVIAFLHFSIAVVCTFFEEESPSHYGLWFIFVVAAAAIIKIVLSTFNAMRTRNNHNMIIHHVKLIDNANALIALGLTQRAIVYFIGNETARWISGLGGMFFSLCALCVCLTMFIKYKHAITQDKKNI